MNIYHRGVYQKKFTWVSRNGHLRDEFGSVDSKFTFFNNFVEFRRRRWFVFISKIWRVAIFIFRIVRRSGDAAARRWMPSIICRSIRSYVIKPETKMTFLKFLLTLFYLQLTCSRCRNCNSPAGNNGKSSTVDRFDYEKICIGTHLGTPRSCNNDIKRLRLFRWP